MDLPCITRCHLTNAAWRPQHSTPARLAALYERHAQLLRQDRFVYDARDTTAARSDAEAILRSLADDSTSDAEHWQLEVARAWTALLSSYDEVRAAATWLYRADDALDLRFPSLYRVIRPRAGRPSSAVERLAGAVEPTSVVPSDPAARA